MKNCVVTIVSGNYLAYARVLQKSLLAMSSDFNLRVLIVDKKTSQLEKAVSESGLDYVFAEQLNLPDMDRLFYKYDIVELNTALKPTFIKLTFQLGYERVIYLDPDIRVFAPLTPVLDALNSVDIVLTPHSLAPVMDDLRPSDVDFLRTGAYNLGFIGMRASDQANKMLDWWESRCLGMGFNDTGFGIFVDQKWIDLVPSYFDSVKILRHPGCNVAYWNLHERSISNSINEFIVNGYPLIFFHFSGVSATNPTVLSKHQTRHKIVQGAVLERLIKDYCQELLAMGHVEYSNIQYGFGRLNDGTVITPSMRRALLVMPYTERAPFSNSSQLQKDLAAVGITNFGRNKIEKSHNTMTFNEADYRVIWVNKFIRLSARIIGLERLISILRYAALMTRETNLPAVLLKRPLSLVHKLRR
jgi:hypothetical protein